MEAAIALVVLAGLVGLSFLIYGFRDLTKANDWAKLLQAIFTLAAFSLAAYWYFAERKGMPHADVQQSVTVRSLADGIVAVEAHVAVKNLGARLLRLNEIQSYLQDVEATTYNYAQLAELEDALYWTAARPSNGGAHFTRAELRWPVVRGFHDQVEHRIEPGETDLIVITFLVQCKEVADTVRVATDILRPDAGPERHAWKTRSFTDLGDACSEGSGGR